MFIINVRIPSIPCGLNSRASIKGRKWRSGKRILLWFCLFLAITARVENQALAAPKLRFKHLTKEDGLSDNSVNMIAQDKQGFIWIGTTHGLNRYDGRMFTIYRNDPMDRWTLRNSRVSSILCTSDSSIWVGTEGGLHLYDRDYDRFHRFENDPADSLSLSDNYVRTMFEDSQGNLWIGTYRGLNMFEPGTGTFRRFEHDPADPNTLSGKSISAMCEDSSGGFWIGTFSNGLNYLDRDGRLIRYQHDPDDETSISFNSISNIAIDRNGNVWVATDAGGLNLFEPEKGTFVRFKHDRNDEHSISSNRLWCIYEDSKDNLWIGTDDGGLNLFDREHRSFTRYIHDEYDVSSLNPKGVRAIFEDNTGLLWIGNYVGGVNVLNANAIAFMHERQRPGNPKSLSNNAVLSFLEDSKGNLWVGTEGGLNLRLQGGDRFEHFLHDPDKANSLSADAITALLEDRMGRIWISTFFGGLNRYDPQTRRFTRFFYDENASTSDNNTNLWDLHEDSCGAIWVGTFSGVKKWSPATGTFKTYPSVPGDSTSIGHPLVWQIYEDTDRNLWFGTHGGLSLYIPATDNFRTYDEFKGNWITSIYEDDKKRFWVGTHGSGLTLFDRATTKSKTLRSTDGLPSDVILGIVEDESGNLWMSTNNGICKFNYDTGSIHSYDERDGLQGRQFNKFAIMKSRAGELFFGGLNGYNHFFPADIKESPHIPPIVLTGFEIFNRPAGIGANEPLPRHINQADKIILAHDQSVFSIFYSALNYRSPGKSRFKYQLEGFDQGWLDAGTRRFATYTNLSPGSYTFHVTGTNDSGIWNEHVKSIEIEIIPAFWQTRWFWALVGFFVFGVAWLLYQDRTKKIRRHNQQLTEVNARLNEEISERRRAEQEVMTLNEQLEHRVRVRTSELEAANTELEVFAYSVSHDLRSPLRAIDGFSLALMEDCRNRLTKDELGTLERVRSASQRLGQLIDDLLDLSKITRVGLTRQRVDLGGLADSIIEELREQEPGRQVDFESQIGLHADGDPKLLRIALTNLLSNSWKFTARNEKAMIQFGGHRVNGSNTFFVKDNGVGFDMKYRSKLFGAFQRLHRVNEFPGSGIGLATVKRVVDRHGGQVWAEGEVGNGATFYFTLQAST